MEAVNIKINNMYYKIKDFENYAISFNGIVINTKSNRVLKQKLNKNGYYSVTLSKNNKLYFKYIHRLVSETFIKSNDIKNIVNHKDGNKLNNSIDNLEWVTQKENIVHSWENGLSKPSEIQKKKAAENCKKRSNKIYDTTNGYIFLNINEAAKKLGLKPKTLYAKLNGQIKNNTTLIYG